MLCRRQQLAKKAPRDQAPQYCNCKALNSANNLKETGRTLQPPDKNAAQPIH